MHCTPQNDSQEIILFSPIPQGRERLTLTLRERQKVDLGPNCGGDDAI